MLLEGLELVEDEIAAGAFVWDLTDEDVHMALERRLTELVGPVGGKVHTAAAATTRWRSTSSSTCATRWPVTWSARLALMETLLRRAEESLDVVMPGYTHLQRAQPVLLAHHLLAYVALLEREAGRLLRWFASSAGCLWAPGPWPG